MPLHVPRWIARYAMHHRVGQPKDVSEISIETETPRVEQELLETYAAQGWLVPIAIVFSALLIVSLAWSTAPRALSVGWFAMVVGVVVVRARAQQWLKHARHVPLSRRMKIAAAISALGGVTHGASILFWPYFSDLERALLTTYVLGLSSGAVAGVVGYMPVFLAYMLPLLVPLVVQWVSVLVLTPEQGTFGPAAVMLLMFAIYGGFLVVLARDTFRRYRESFDSRQLMQLALQQAEAANRSKTRFLASASHDLRQPMHTLTLFSAALSMAPLEERARHIANQMNVALQALSSQLDALLDVSKLDAGVVSVQASVFALRPFVDQLVSEFDPVARRKGLQLVLESPHDVSVLADALLLERVLRNLIDNAIKYTERGEVRVQIHRHETHLLLCVRDTGIGIPQDEQQRVFDEFYQLGNAERNRSQGLGLGLSIVKRLAELMQMHITLRSEYGVGTEVSVRLHEAPTVAATAEAVSVPSSPPIRGLRLLVVDDEDQVRQGMRAVLEGLGCEVTTVADVEAACMAAQISRPDAVLADLRLRGQVDGIQTITRLRALQPHLSALLISGDTAPERLREANAAGLRLLHKPVPLAVLTQAIREEVDGAWRCRQETDA